VNSSVSLRLQARLWFWQRMSAIVLALCVVVHLIVIMVAVRGGLTAAEVLQRTRQNWAFAAFYVVFVLACTVHVPAGLLTIAQEWLGWRSRTAVVAAWLFAAVLAVAGLRAVYGVVMP
jgi:fumarate reductase subunit C